MLQSHFDLMLAGVNRLRRARGIGSQLFSFRSDEGLSSGAGQSFATFLTWSPLGSPKSCDGPFLRRLAVSGSRDKGSFSNKDVRDGPTAERQEAASAAADGHESPSQPGSEPQNSGPEVGSSTSGPEEPADAAKDELMALFEEQLRKLAGSSTVQTAELRDGGLFGGQSLFQSLRDWLVSLHVRGIQAGVEKEFDPEEFLEGAKDAYFTVNQLLGEGDFEAARDMVSPKFLAAFRETHDQYAKVGLKMRLKLAPDIEAALHWITLVTRDELARWENADEDAESPSLSGGVQGAPANIGPGSATAALPPPSSGFPSLKVPYLNLENYWLLACVRFRSQLTSEVVNADGQLVQQLKDFRTHKWYFSRGPLPRQAPVRVLDSQWKVASMS